MKITDVRCERVTTRWPYDGPLDEERPVRPADIYPECRFEGKLGIVPPGGPPYAMEAVFVFVDTDEGVSGMFGPVQPDLVPIIKGALRRVVIGEHPHAVARIWDKMYRLAIHGRKGPTMMAISAIDIALWDLKGKLLGAPVFALLGGPTRERIPAYASMLGYSVEPEKVAARTAEVVAQGYKGVKWFFRHGPAAGPEGVRQNLELIRTVREAAGADTEIMLDAWNSWDVPYTLRLVELARDYGPAWIEEPVMPDMIEQYAEIRRSIRSIAIAGGEHEYTRWGFKALLDAGAVDILQPDPAWAGGLTETVRICALASAYGIPVVLHHGGAAAAHLIAAQPPATCPMQEWLIQIGLCDQIFFEHKIEPENGYIALPDRPGLGLELNDEVIESRSAL